MAIFTVHEPPLRKGESVSDPERFVFVREGFRLWAFLLPPVWMLLQRMWLILVLYLVLNAAVAAALHFFGAPDWARFAVMMLLGLLVGLEAATLQRWTLWRRRWKTVGTVSGETAEAAERRFFDAWVARADDRATVMAMSTAPPPPRMSGGDSDVMGLFPRPGGGA